MVVDRLIDLRAAGFTTIEPTAAAEAGWARHMEDCAQITLHRLANTWYTGSNVPGKPLGVMPYTGGVGPYRGICDDVVEQGMLGFRLTGPAVRRSAMTARSSALQPDARACSACSPS